MTYVKDKEYLIIVQCHIVQERCSGFHCEKAFHDRTGGFAGYPKDKAYRTLSITCGGCCGRALHRKLSHLIRLSHKRDRLDKSRMVVHLSSCITKDNYHAPPCPHLNYLKALISRAGLDLVEDTWVSKTAEKRRQRSIYTVDNKPSQGTDDHA